MLVCVYKNSTTCFSYDMPRKKNMTNCYRKHHFSTDNCHSKHHLQCKYLVTVFIPHQVKLDTCGPVNTDRPIKHHLHTMTDVYRVVQKVNTYQNINNSYYYQRIKESNIISRYWIFYAGSIAQPYAFKINWQHSLPVSACFSKLWNPLLDHNLDENSYATSPIYLFSLFQVF